MYPSISSLQHHNDDHTHTTATQMHKSQHKSLVILCDKQQLHHPDKCTAHAETKDEHRISNSEHSAIEFSDFKIYFDVSVCGQTDKGRSGRERGKGRFEINCLSRPIIISAWLLRCLVGPACTPKSINAAADTVGGGIYAV